jgi:hypothetical protein
MYNLIYSDKRLPSFYSRINTISSHQQHNTGKSMKGTVLSLLLLLASSGYAQTYSYVYRNQQDSTINCYLALIPGTGEIRGLVVRDYSSLPDTSNASPFRLQKLMAQSGLMTLYTVTSKAVPGLYYDDAGPALLDDIIHEVMTRYRIPGQNLFLGGISASGTRALRFTQYCNEGKSKYGTSVSGVFAVDSPLDLERFYKSAQANRSNFKKGMLTEANLVLKAFPTYLGTPEENPDSYRKVSVYSQSDTAIGNVKYFKDVSLIIFHEPDIDWWIRERGASYFDINSFDIAGFVVKLQKAGNTDVELVTTTGKGFDRNGERKPHSWTIVDEDHLAEWIIRRLN